MKKRIMSLFLAIAFILTLLPNIVQSVSAETIASGTGEEGLHWELDSEGTLTISGEGSMADYWFAGAGHTWLSTNLGTRYQGGYAYDVKHVVIAPGITKIGDHAFGNSNIVSIDIPNTVTTIGYHAFLDCEELVNIIIPDSVSEIGQDAFSGCENLNKLTFLGNAPKFDNTGLGIFDNVNAVAYYPQNNTTWTANVMQNYGGTITWMENTSVGQNEDVYSEGGNGMYVPVVESCIDKCRYYGLDSKKQENCRGLLYDLDNNGQDELILQYEDDYQLAYEIWTIVNGIPKCVLGDPFYDGKSKTISLVAYDGNHYFVLNSFYSGSSAAGSQWSFFLVSDGTFQKAYTLMEEDFWDDDSAEIWYSINGKSVSKREYTEISECLEGEKIIPIDTEGMVLDELIDNLVNASKIDETESGRNNTPLSAYIPIVEQAIIDAQSIGREKGFGTLYDVDGNGVDELIMVHPTFDEEHGFSAKACSLYTVSNGRAIPLIDTEILFVEVGGPSGHAAVISSDGKHKFVITSENGDGINRFGSWEIYTLQGNSLILDTTVEFECYRYYDSGRIDYDSSHATFNGKKCSYREYEEWKEALVEIVWVYPYDDSYNNAMSLEELLEYLKNNPVENSSSTTEDHSFENYARTEWIEQHMEYAASDEYRTEIVGGYNGRMLAVFRDALDDGGIGGYRLAKNTSRILGLDFELSETEMYELILAEILYSRTSLAMGSEAYKENYNKALQDVAKLLVAAANVADGSSKIPKDALNSINDLYAVLKTLSTDSPDFDATYSQFVKQIKENVSEPDLVKGFKSDATFTALGIVVDGLFETYNSLEDILQYMNNYIAYQSTSQQLKEVLMRLSVVVLYEYEGLYGVEELEELGIWDAMVNWGDFSAAVVSFMNVLADYEQDGAAAVAEYAVERAKEGAQKFGDKAFKSIFVFGLDTIASKIPVLNAIVLAKNVLNVGVLVTEVLTNVDEREYALDMLTKIYCISVALDKTVDDCADAMDENNFYASTVFDESVNVYSGTQLLASDFALKYADMVLANAEEDLYNYDEGWGIDHLFTSREKMVAIVEWYSNSYKLLEEQRTEIQSIACHDSDLSYNQLTDEIIYNFKDSRIYVVACPVDMIVKNEVGEQIAYLSGENDQVVEGYEFYFHTIKTTDDSGEYIKVAIVPNGYQIELVGTDDGTMNAFVTDFTTGGVGEVETYVSIPVEKDSVGCFEASSENSTESRLVMDQVVYSNMASKEDIPSNTESDGTWLWIIGGITIVGILIVIFGRNKKAILIFIIAAGVLAACYFTIHFWTDATCTEAETCKLCGKERGAALGHDWQQATCSEPSICIRCRETTGNPIAHQWTDATCTDPEKCCSCGTVNTPALGHTWSDATCTQASTCRICGKSEGMPLGHQWTDATYTSPKTCTSCGATEGTRLFADPIYLNELGVMSSHVGKVWTRSSIDPSGVFHTRQNTNWDNWDIPGHTTGIVRDNGSIERTYAIFIDGEDNQAYYMEFHLDGKYTKFSGYCASPDKQSAVSKYVYDFSARYSKYFEVYGDGKYIGRSSNMRYDYVPEHFEFDVTGVDVMRIVYPESLGPNEVASIYDGLLE